jgi:hypothetical protein
MDINRMRLGLMYIFKESDKIGTQSKLQLCNFIEQADEIQLKTLALDGAITEKDSLDEDAIEILNQRFEASDVILKSLKKASLEAIKLLNK